MAGPAARSVTLSERGCQTIAQESGHVVAIDEPQVVVEAIRSVVETARGRTDVPLCGRAVAGRGAEEGRRDLLGRYRSGGTTTGSPSARPSTSNACCQTAPPFDR